MNSLTDNRLVDTRLDEEAELLIDDLFAENQRLRQEIAKLDHALTGSEHERAGIAETLAIRERELTEVREQAAVLTGRVAGAEAATRAVEAAFARIQERDELRASEELAELQAALEAKTLAYDQLAAQFAERIAALELERDTLRSAVVVEMPVEKPCEPVPKQVDPEPIAREPVVSAIARTSSPSPPAPVEPPQAHSVLAQFTKLQKDVARRRGRKS